MSTQPDCPVCGNAGYYWDTVDESAYAMHRVTDREFNRAHFIMYRCTRCGHGFFSPGVESAAELATLYGASYGADYLPDPANERFRQRLTQYALDVRTLDPFLMQSRPRVLDFGCSTGLYLKAMPDRWERCGYEINRTETDYIRSHFPELVIYNALEEVPAAAFDCVTLRGVIEHLFDFDGLFDLLDRCLCRDGMVFISATPDFDSPAARAYGAHWNQVCVPFHYHQFTAASLAHLMAYHGYALRLLEHQYLGTPYACPDRDGTAFVANVRALAGGRGTPADTTHAYPGTMLAALFARMEVSGDARP